MFVLIVLFSQISGCMNPRNAIATLSTFDFEGIQKEMDQGELIALPSKGIIIETSHAYNTAIVIQNIGDTVFTYCRFVRSSNPSLQVTLLSDQADGELNVSEAEIIPITLYSDALLLANVTVSVYEFSNNCSNKKALIAEKNLVILTAQEVFNG
jgi:hypothetical protein